MSLDPNHSYGSIRGAVAGKSNRHDPVLINTPAWMDQANCRGAYQASDAAETKGLTRQFVRRYCGTCPVKQQCFDLGVKVKATSGVWGGIWFTCHGLPAHESQESAC